MSEISLSSTAYAFAKSIVDTTHQYKLGENLDIKSPYIECVCAHWAKLVGIMWIAQASHTILTGKASGLAFVGNVAQVCIGADMVIAGNNMFELYGKGPIKDVLFAIETKEEEASTSYLGQAWQYTKKTATKAWNTHGTTFVYDSLSEEAKSQLKTRYIVENTMIVKMAALKLNNLARQSSK